MDFELAGAVILSGLTIVFAVLVLLTFILMALGRILGGAGKKNEQGPAEKAAPAPAPAPVKSNAVQPAVEDGISDETVAVISASIAAMLGGGVVVRGVKRALGHKGRRTAWGMAGMQQNTSPF